MVCPAAIFPLSDSQSASFSFFVLVPPGEVGSRGYLVLLKAKKVLSVGQCRGI